MTRRRSEDPPPLFVLPDPRAGRHERSVNQAIRRGQRDQVIDAHLDGGLASLARGLARAADVAEQAKNPWAMAAVARELRETLTRLRLDPASRGADRDAWDDFLAAINDEPAGTRPLGDPPPA
jgi:predicted RNA-binding Zn ribbon-like protein